MMELRCYCQCWLSSGVSPVCSYRHGNNGGTPEGGASRTAISSRPFQTGPSAVWYTRRVRRCGAFAGKARFYWGFDGFIRQLAAERGMNTDEPSVEYTWSPFAGRAPMSAWIVGTIQPILAAMGVLAAKRQVADAAAHAEAKAVIERWNEQLATSRDMLRSPTIRAALIAAASDTPTGFVSTPSDGWGSGSRPYA
jgi:hypothetical protein